MLTCRPSDYPPYPPYTEPSDDGTYDVDGNR